ncbi:vitamin B12-dependent ribonucleotide reductase [Candidatus Microgenomates bacterium]|nr:vitamin B12-dependent ribonucleotide reductase [Candidatus Microgenomates bacterium]
MSTSTTLGIRRHFTVEGKHPYDELEWERRDARITNFMDGSVSFEQKDVEFPVAWSQNATNIVAQKYFWGTPGTADRESSLRQLIDRVADTITKHGRTENYFASDEEATIFNHELKHILVNQKASFNSPVWFNIGALDRSQQASACFILAVDDTMESILNWYFEEGMIFKGGSGAGINLSKLRSSLEILNSSGGKASGPVSFMRGADASAGTIKSGGKTRRAAKMVILNVDHPDVEEFIWCKALEERKARALAEAGFDMDIDGKDSFSVQYQNANNSVRVTDEFMQAVVEDRDWDLKAVKNGEPVKTLKARDLMHQIADAAWQCADPGMQYDTTINYWHTASNTDRINGSNPCSEYMHLDNSACNLASINLLKYLNSDGTFDVESYRQTVEVVITAQEILVGYSSYPTESIAKNAKAFRELGMGYANLGALLMAEGLPYDSDEGRAYAAALTALMTGHAYATSAKIARRIGPFEGYEVNREPMQRVLEQHRAEVSKINASLVSEELLSAAQVSWDEAVDGCRRYGVRNSQATVLAPTGTIGFMMDCDTTGVEPDLSLVKMKKLVGGGNMSIVNQTVPRALKSLGYTPEQVTDIIKYIDEEKTIVGAPHLRAEHLPVFATAIGDNVIHYMGHVKMMAAVQPFLSGAISKTVNMPPEVTIEDVMDLYIEAWRMGLKAIAIYREGSKVAEPLKAGKKGDKTGNEPAAEDKAEEVADSSSQLGVKSEEAPVATSNSQLPAPSSQSFVVKAPVRKEMPRKRTARVFEFSVGGVKGFFTVGEYDDGKPGEVFIQIAKQGSTLAGIMDAFAISISNGLQYGVPLRFYVKKFMSMNFAPAGITDDPQLPTASSLVDYIFRRLAVEYLGDDDLLELGLVNELEGRKQESQVTLLDHVPPAPTPAPNSTTPLKDEVVVEPEEVGVSSQELEQTNSTSNSQLQSPGSQPEPRFDYPIVSQDKLAPQQTSDAPLCYNCGNPTQRAGSCYVCTSCGTTSGCS